MHPKTIIYTRISLDSTGEGLGVERQEDACRALCAARGYEVAQVIADNNQSATTGRRAGYERLLRDIERKHCDVVVAYRVDRLLRKMTELEQLIELCERTGVQIVTVQGDLDLSNSSGRLVSRLLASVARAEVETKSERQIAAAAQKARAGLPAAARRAFGYEKNYTAIRESEAALLREMASKIIGGQSFGTVTAWFNEHGYHWPTMQLKKVLTNRRYIGLRFYKGGEYPAQWEPIFTLDTWEQLQYSIQRRHDEWARGNRATKRTYLLTGLVFCGRCGQRLSGGQSRGKPSDPLRRRYMCRVNGDSDRWNGCGLQILADPLDHLITESVLYRLDSPDMAKLLTNGQDDGQLKELLSQRTATQARLDGFADDYATGLLNKAEYARVKATATAQLDRIEQEIDRLSSQGRFPAPLALGESLRTSWDSADSQEWRRSLLALLIKQILILPSSRRPVYNIGTEAYRFDPLRAQVTWSC